MPTLAPSPDLFPSPTLYPGESLSPGGPATTLLLSSFAPWLAHDASGHHTQVLIALGGMLDQVATLVSDQGFLDDTDFVPGWSILLDPNNSPDWALPFTSQFNGTVVPPGTDETTARMTILAEAGFQRGTQASIVQAVQNTLTGSQSCLMLERTGPSGADPYHFIVIVRPEQVLSLSALVAAVNDTKPAGTQWTLVETDSWTIAQMEASEALLGTLEGDFATVDGLEQDQPGQ